ncbi:pyridoxamine 5'-phosphate oxidase family protein [Paraflavitalea sp. CAU 1676]|uniref:pyridoxamine 5'-phosphate oxidase family protein n=1 Tax=Paraflavitalea sp. CAU 1676 TaxID=3032598 RepID=UPI0023DCC0E7|nr:pyridoxamine 5'-phosphate oxidase family protein [Paraflavitalea sp. CAU 1676]MDF2189859.1 pyridoxamine 5'-phosphate oxidase family protein [Paraflavitalea sp. CAU 1676]
MNSINKNQPEDNHESLSGAAAIKKIRELATKADTCFFCTHITQGAEIKTRPMSVQEVDNDGNLWFLSASDSHTNQEINEDGSVQLFFQGSAHADFLTLYGKAVISNDKKKIDELWKPLFKTWFTEGKDDPRITILRVTPESGYYWDNKHGNAIAFVKMVAGAMMGKTLDDSIEGSLKL